MKAAPQSFRLDKCSDPCPFCGEENVPYMSRPGKRTKQLLLRYRCRGCDRYYVVPLRDKPAN